MFEALSASPRTARVIPAAGEGVVPDAVLQRGVAAPSDAVVGRQRAGALRLVEQVRVSQRLRAAPAAQPGASKPLCASSERGALQPMSAYLSTGEPRWLFSTGGTSSQTIVLLTEPVAACSNPNSVVLCGISTPIAASCLLTGKRHPHSMKPAMNMALQPSHRKAATQASTHFAIVVARRQQQGCKQQRRYQRGRHCSRGAARAPAQRRAARARGVAQQQRRRHAVERCPCHRQAQRGQSAKV